MEILNHVNVPNDEEVNQRSQRALNKAIAAISARHPVPLFFRRYSWAMVAAVIAIFITGVMILQQPSYRQQMYMSYTEEYPSVDDAAVWFFLIENDHLVSEYIDNPTKENRENLEEGAWSFVNRPEYFDYAGSDIDLYLYNLPEDDEYPFLYEVMKYEQSKLVASIVE